MDCSPPGSSVPWDSPGKHTGWVVMPSPRGSSWPKDWTCVSCVSCIAGGFFTSEPLWKPNTHSRCARNACRWPNFLIHQHVWHTCAYTHSHPSGASKSPLTSVIIFTFSSLDFIFSVVAPPWQAKNKEKSGTLNSAKYLSSSYWQLWSWPWCWVDGPAPRNTFLGPRPDGHEPQRRRKEAGPSVPTNLGRKLAFLCRRRVSGEGSALGVWWPWWKSSSRRFIS